MSQPLRRATVSLLLAAGGLQACGFGGLEGRQTIAGQLRSEMRDVQRQIEQEVGDASAQRLEQCRVLALGSKACGGPQSYLIYSTSASDAQRLQELARQYTEAEQKYNRVTGTVSTCAYLMPPQVRLASGKCEGSRQTTGK